MTTMEWLEALSYAVTIIGLPLAIYVFLNEQNKERLNDDEELYLKLSDEYAGFLKLVLENADLQLMTYAAAPAALTPEQAERRAILFEILISLFERAYILVYEADMSEQAARLWSTWDDYMREWCRRADFRSLLPMLLEGEDPNFAAYIRVLAEQEGRTCRPS